MESTDYGLQNKTLSGDWKEEENKEDSQPLKKK